MKMVYLARYNGGFGSYNNTESRTKPSGFYSTLPAKSWFSSLRRKCIITGKKPLF